MTYCLEGSCSIQLSYWRMKHHSERLNGEILTITRYFPKTMDIYGRNLQN